jgi:tRNA dimethylallyltransferase
MKPKVVIILGPTAVGKSAVALALAMETGAEIVNADSQQIYRHMDIGTWKPSREMRQQVVHHLIDIVEPTEDFNAALFREKAIEVIRDIDRRNSKALVCGGTGLYIKALTHGIFVGPARDERLRTSLASEAEKSGLGPLYKRLRELDPHAAAAIHPHDRVRIVRALEVYALTGKRLSQWQREHNFQDSWCETLKIGLERARDELYTRINHRCEEMFSLGLVEEVKSLVTSGYNFDLKAMQSIGYRHAGLYVRGAVNLGEALELMKRDTRRFAKRQLTWFRADREIRWFHPERDRNEILTSITEFWR